MQENHNKLKTKKDPGCGTWAGMVRSQDPGQEPEPPVCNLRQNTKRHEDIFLSSAGTRLTVFRQLPKYPLPATALPVSPLLIHPPPPGSLEEDAEMMVTGETKIIDRHADLFSPTGRVCKAVNII